MSSPFQRTDGFTLIELLVAIAMTGLIGLAANSMLDVMLRSSQQVGQQQTQLTKLDSGLRILQRDLQQLSPRMLSGDDFIKPSLGLLLRPVSQAVGSTFMEFIRFHQVPSKSGADDQLIRVRYRLLDEQLIREQRPYPATPDQQNWHKTVILENISAIEIMVYTSQWQEVFGNLDNSDIPQAIQFTLTHPQWQHAKLTVNLPRGKHVES